MFPNQNNVAASGPGPAADGQQSLNYNGLPAQQPQQQQQLPQSTKNVRKKPYVKITEQPAGKALRFRYECEGRSAGSIPGVNSTPENKTYPTIEIVGYKGRAVVVVSCVTKDTPYRPHPHNLVGKEGCKKGVCTLEINSETMRAVFSNLGIQCVKKKDIEAALKAREEIRVDPFKSGFTHRFQPSSIDLNSVRLCFQVFMESEQKGRFTSPLPPVVSEPIFDKKAMSDLVICRLCSCSATVLGNTQIILLCEKVAKEDISVRFFEEKNGQSVWEAFGDFQHTDVHKQTAITFKTPRYHTLDITEPAKVFIQLRRPSDGVTSEALPFEYVPMDSDPAHLRRKRQKTGGDPMHLLLQQQQKQQLQNDHQDGRQTNMNCWNAQIIPPIKTEPRDTSPQPFGLAYRAPPELTPSPQPLSPSSNYNHNSTPSPYNMAPSVTPTNGQQQLMSPNHPQQQQQQQQQQQYGATDLGNNYNPFAQQVLAQQQQQHQQQQQQQQQQHQQQQQQHQQQQQQQQALQFHANPFGNPVGNNWESKFTAAAVAAAAATATGATPANGNSNNLSNLNNPFTMHNLLTSGGGPGNGSNLQWNLTPNHLNQHTLHQQQQLQQQHVPPMNQYDNNATSNNNPNNGNANNNNNTAGNQADNGPTISNLLSFDSGQLVNINSEDQQILRLNSEDLQISNLSIST
ncbi:embryonic polarity protein dorsal isoform X3 [Drosophila subpulchrella]|uniref:embryonic polarity protein dorsal isoform X3 n=1 Tax=Drosophila subpulchrella TaxID=1486046 RepID=UPI0018A1805C|nr:embryonic polarity protein dorsal isoform X3 [Drosophila subpulchrella]